MTSDPVKHILSQFGKRQMTTTQNLAERLEELSKKATPGPWKAAGELGNDNFAESIYCDGYKGLLIARVNQNSSYPSDATLITELVNNLPTILSALRSRDSVIDAPVTATEVTLRQAKKALEDAKFKLYGLNAGNVPWIDAPLVNIEAALSSHAETAGMVSVPVEAIALVEETLELYADPTGYTDSHEDPYTADDKVHPGVGAAEALSKFRAMIKAAKGGEK